MDENQTVNLHFQKFDKSYPIKDTGESLQVSENRDARKMVENLKSKNKKQKGFKTKLSYWIKGGSAKTNLIVFIYK